MILWLYELAFKLDCVPSDERKKVVVDILRWKMKLKGLQSG